jgi:hypothetical protein
MAIDDRLSIDYWHTTVAVALGTLDGPISVAIDGAARWPSGVAVDTEGVLRAGLAGAEYGSSHAQSYVRMPAQRLLDDRIGVGSAEIRPVDLLIATLSMVAYEVRKIRGSAPGGVVVGVPTGWVRRQREAMATAGKAAGFRHVTVVNAAESIVRHQIGRGAAVPIGSAAVVCRLDATVGELVIVRRHADRFEVAAAYDLGEVGEAVGATLVDQAGWALIQGLESTAIDGSEIAGVYCQVPVGGMRALAAKLAASADMPVTPVEVADLAAAFGTAQMAGTEPEPAAAGLARSGLPGSFLATAIAWLAAGVLSYQMVGSAAAYPKAEGVGMWLHTQMYAWALVPVFATLGAAAVALAVSRLRRTASAGPDPGLGSALVLVAVLGVGSAAVLSLIGASHFGADPAPLLRWTLASTVPLAAVLLTLGLLVARTGPPAPGARTPAPWRDLLRLPLPALTLAALSTVVIVASVVDIPPVDSDWWLRMMRIGAFFAGWAVAFLLPVNPWRRVWVGSVLSAAATWSVGIETAGVLTSVLVAAITFWWLLRLTPIVRRMANAFTRGRAAG